jgi:hypothetical protein
VTIKSQSQKCHHWVISFGTPIMSASGIFFCFSYIYLWSYYGHQTNIDNADIKFVRRLRWVDESMMSSRISPPVVGELSRRFGDTVVFIFKGISVNVSVAGLYLLIYRWVLGVHASYWWEGPEVRGWCGGRWR